MKIRLNKEDLHKLYELIEVKEANIQIASLLNDLCFSLDTFDFINESVSLNEKDFSLRAIEEFFNYFELDEDNEDNQYYINNYLNGSFKYVDLDEYEKNSYKKHVKPQEISYNGYKLHYLKYPSGSFFPLDDIKVNEKDLYREKTILGISNKDYKYLTLSKNNNIWMCITPNEIETMKPHLEKAKGRVITFGLGLGYYAYMASNKAEVIEVTIVEKDKDIINLFNQYLLPHFPHKEKINIIQRDALEYIRETRLIVYNYAFFDLWHNAEDGLELYSQIHKLKIIPPYSCWIEESLIAMYRRCILTVIEESLSGYNDDDYRRHRNSIEKIINEIYFKTKRNEFNSFDEIVKFISKENILKLLKI